MASLAQVERMVENHCWRNLAEAGALMVQQAKDNVSGGGVSGLRVQSGTLRDSIGMVMERQRGLLSLYVGVNMGATKCPYARIHEMGGVTEPPVTLAMRMWAKRIAQSASGQKPGSRTIYLHPTDISLGPTVYWNIWHTKKATLEVHVPARPYLRPVLDQRAMDLRVILLRGPQGVQV